MTTTRTTTRWPLIAMAMAMVLSLLAAVSPINGPLSPPPAEAAQLEADSGVIPAGTAEVAKAFEFCRYTGDKPKLVEWKRKAGSPGLGMPDPLVKKNAWWGVTAQIMSTVKGSGILNACGYLTAMVDEEGVQLGAACGASKGWNGIGTIKWFNGGTKTVGKPKINGVTQLTDISWKVSVEGTLPVTANMVDPKDKGNKIGFLEATVQTAGGADCVQKGPGQPPKGDPKDGGEQGANAFALRGVYETVRHYGKKENPPKKDTTEKKRPHEKPE